MSKGMKKLLIFVALVVLVVGGYKWRYPTYSWHQKLAIEIETLDGMKSGSSVVAVSWSKVPKFLPDMHYASNEVSGEATVVDLGNGKYLFALLRGTSTLAQRTFIMSSVGYSTDAWLYPAGKVSSYMGKKADIKGNYIPMLVTFDDINDPKTVKRVDPYDLDASFGCGFSSPPSGSMSPSPDPPPNGAKASPSAGSERTAQGERDSPSVAGQAERSDAPARERTSARMGGQKTGSAPASGVSENNSPSVAGQASAMSGSASPRTGGGSDDPAKNHKCYKLKSITLEITDEPVTKGVVEGVLGWWCDLSKARARLNGSTSIGISTNELSDTLGTGAFRIGECT